MTFASTSLLPAIATVLTASQAFAMCKEKLEIALGDGSTACVEVFETRSNLMLLQTSKSEPSSRRIVPSEWIYLVLSFPNERNAGGFREPALLARAKEACARLRLEMLQKLQNPGDTVLEVVLAWGKNLRKPALEHSPNYRAFKFSRDCKASLQ